MVLKPRQRLVWRRFNITFWLTAKINILGQQRDLQIKINKKLPVPVLVAVGKWFMRYWTSLNLKTSFFVPFLQHKNIKFKAYWHSRLARRLKILFSQKSWIKYFLRLLFSFFEMFLKLSYVSFRKLFCNLSSLAIW